MKLCKDCAKEPYCKFLEGIIIKAERWDLKLDITDCKHKKEKLTKEAVSELEHNDNEDALKHHIATSKGQTSDENLDKIKPFLDKIQPTTPKASSKKTSSKKASSAT